jgi:hypothetical protein
MLLISNALTILARHSIEKILDNGSRIIIDEKAWRGEIHDYLKTENGEREIDFPTNVAKLLVEFVGDRKSGLLFCTRNDKQLSQSNILRRHLHPALAEVGLREGWEPRVSPFP